MSKFYAQIHADVVKLGGVIDEDNQLGDLVEKVPRGTVYIDLGDVERINSCGVRDWVNWLGRLEHNGSSGVLVECSPAIVAQINLVNNFTGNGVVKSFYVPYFCPECDEEKVLLVEAIDMGPPPHEPPTCRCDECDLVMDFDDMPDSYFAFLAQQNQGHNRPANGHARPAGAPTATGSSPGTGHRKVRSRGSAPLVPSDLATPPTAATPTRTSVPSLPARAAGGGSGAYRTIDVPPSGATQLPAVVPSPRRASAFQKVPELEPTPIGSRMLESRGNAALYLALVGAAIVIAVVLIIVAR